MRNTPRRPVSKMPTLCGAVRFPHALLGRLDRLAGHHNSPQRRAAALLRLTPLTSLPFALAANAVQPFQEATSRHSGTLWYALSLLPMHSLVCTALSQSVYREMYHSSHRSRISCTTLALVSNDTASTSRASNASVVIGAVQSPSSFPRYQR